jgi:HEPN domain-containing protein
MAEPKRELVDAWLRAAMDDLGAAGKLIDGMPAFPGAALYHCQQCAEKALKAFLLLNDVEFEKTHNLSVLIELCADINIGFHDLADYAEALTPYATLYRYPDEVEAAEISQAARALEMARKIFVFVSSTVNC